jgi:hypothetical protein
LAVPSSQAIGELNEATARNEDYYPCTGWL